MNDDLELMYALMMEGKQYLDLMYLPADAVAWLFDQPEGQVQTAMALAKESHLSGNEVINATLLKDDQLIIILQLASGRKIRIYPDGGLSSDGQPYDMGDLVTLIADDIPGVEMGGPMHMDDLAAAGGRHELPDQMPPGDPMAVEPELPPIGPEQGATAEPTVPGHEPVVAPQGGPEPMIEPMIEPMPDEGLEMQDDLLGGMGVKPLSDLM